MLKNEKCEYISETTTEEKFTHRLAKHWIKKQTVNEKK